MSYPSTPTREGRRNSDRQKRQCLQQLRKVVCYIVEFVPRANEEQHMELDTPAQVFRQLFMPVVFHPDTGRLCYAFSYEGGNAFQITTTPVPIWANAHYPGFLEATVFCTENKQQGLDYLNNFQVAHLPNHPVMWRMLGLDPARIPPQFSEFSVPTIDVLFPKSQFIGDSILRGHDTLESAATNWSSSDPGYWDTLYMLFLMHYRCALN